MEEINPLSDARIIVPCKNCIFAHYEGKTQTGCKAGMLDRLKKHGAIIIEAEDTEKEFYIIKNKICMHRRTEPWQEFHAKNEKDYEKLLKIVKLELEKNITAEAIIYVDNNNEEELLRTVESIYNEKYLPSRLVFVVSTNVKIAKMVTIIKSYPHTLPWMVEVIVDESLDARRSMDLFTNTKCKHLYYVTFLSGKTVKQGIFASIKERVIDKMEVFIYEEGDDIHNEIVNVEVHKFLHGNTELPIGEKIRGLQNEKS